ncbi:MAG: TolC family protein [Planctomycetaceae bacterium]|nr:TolC family protein [Planctomycetaceae bacterium]
MCVASGCQTFKPKTKSECSESKEFYLAAAAQVEYPEVSYPLETEAVCVEPPLSLHIPLDQLQYQNLTLAEAVRLALSESKTLRNLGATILRSPDSASTAFDSAIRENDPRLGVQAALSAFDTSFAASVFHQNNDRALNNQFFGGGTRLLQQKATVMQAQLSKQSASGSEFFLRNITDYDKNNAPGNQFPGAWTTQLEGEVRQPLLKGYGVDYWQTVGASQTPGVYSGVLIARTNTDIAQADFEIGVRDFIAEVENAYWDLYFAYRNLDAKVQARDASMELWRRIDALKQLGRAGGEADKEAQAREQLFRFEEDVQNALSGTPQDSTRTYNGTSAGSFRNAGGVLRLERRLRYLIGEPINQGCLLRPVDEPLAAPVCFDWDVNLAESIERRPELRRQQWVIKQKELELVAAEKLLLPKLDAVGLYRWRGFGETLTNPSSGGAPRFDSAMGDLASGRFQEWELGVEFEVPLGNRRAHAGIRTAEFQLARARQVLKEQERVVVHDLSNATSEAIRAWDVLQIVRNRLQAAADQVDSLQAAYEADQAPVNLVLEAQRRFLSAKSDFYKSLLEYNTAIRNVHYEKGSYLEYCSVHVSEGPWADAAYPHAERMERRKHVKDPPPALLREPHIISHGIQSDLQSRPVLVPGSKLPVSADLIPHEPPLLEDVPATPIAPELLPLPQEVPATETFERPPVEEELELEIPPVPPSIPGNSESNSKNPTAGKPHLPVFPSALGPIDWKSAQ